MVRLKALIAYDGTPFCGWQIQKDLPTIQLVVEQALQKICGKNVRVTGAGRTDSGVHAYGQVAHFDWDHPLSGEKLLFGINSLLPEEIRILRLEEISSDFHARFDAVSKLYLYRIHASRFSSPFTFRYALRFYRALDMDLMQQCAKLIEGEHDFAAFQVTGTDVVGTVRTIHRVSIDLESFEHAGTYWNIRFHGSGFLRKMVRLLVGTMLEVSSGYRPVEHLQQAIETADRRFVGVPVAAHGLFLEKVYYDV